MIFGTACYTARMFLSLVHRRFTAWLAALALVFGALAPVVTQAMVRASGPSDWVEICSVSGMSWVKADTGEVATEDQQPMGDSASHHCPWCALHGGAAGAPSVHALPALGPLPSLQPAQALVSVSSPLVWNDAHPRAPPLSA